MWPDFRHLAQTDARPLCGRAPFNSGRPEEKIAWALGRCILSVTTTLVISSATWWREPTWGPCLKQFNACRTDRATWKRRRHNKALRLARYWHLHWAILLPLLKPRKISQRGSSASTRLWTPQLCRRQFRSLTACWLPAQSCESCGRNRMSSKTGRRMSRLCVRGCRRSISIQRTCRARR